MPIAAARDVFIAAKRSRKSAIATESAPLISPSSGRQGISLVPRMRVLPRY